MTKPSAKILIAEDEALIAEDLKLRLLDLGYHVTGIVDRAESVLAVALETSPDLVLLDVRLKGAMDGIAAAERLQSLRRMPFVFVTSYADAATLERACSTQPFGYLVKPFDDRALEASIRAALARHAADSNLRATKDWFGSILHSIGDAVVVTDHEERITYVNPVGERLSRTPVHRAVGQKFDEVFRLVSEADGAVIPSVVHTAIRENRGLQVLRGTNLVAGDGSVTSIEDSVAPLRGHEPHPTGAVVVMRDCSEQLRLLRDNERMQQQLANVQRLQQIGSVVRTLAHDFNNILAAALGGIELCRDEVPPASPLQDQLTRIERTLVSAAELCHRMGSSAGPDRLELAAHDLGNLLQQAVDVVRMQVPGDVEIALDLGSVPPIRADRPQLQRVLTSILINAAEALGNRGHVQVGCRVQRPPFDAHCVLSPAAATLPHAMVEIRDGGHGIDPTLLPRIFDPMFSTKGPGRGLGLAGSLSIVRSHGGGLEVETRPGSGTVFRLLLPLA